VDEQVEELSIPIGGYLWYCLEHKSFGWSMTESECYDTSEFHENGFIPQSSYMLASDIFAELVNSDAYDRDADGELVNPDAVDRIGLPESSYIFDLIVDARSIPDFEKLPEAFWDIDMQDDGSIGLVKTLALVTRLKMTTCSIVIVDVAEAMENVLQRGHEVVEICKEMNVPILIASQLLADRTNGYDGDWRSQLLVEEVEDFLRGDT